MPYYHDPIQSEKQSLASYNKKGFFTSVKEGWLGTDGFQITDLSNALEGIQGGISYFSDTYGGTKTIGNIPDTKYFSKGSGAYNSTTGEFYQPKTDTHTRLRT